MRRKASRNYRNKDMPREVKAYACKFRCGQRVNTHEEIIIEHERQCFKNPENKACPVCKFNDIGEIGYYCELDLKPDGNSTFIRNCDSFEQLKE